MERREENRGEEKKKGNRRSNLAMKTFRREERKMVGIEQMKEKSGCNRITVEATDKKRRVQVRKQRA